MSDGHAHIGAEWLTQLSFTCEQSDGTIWNIFENPSEDRQYAVITGVGQDLLSGPERKELLQLMGRYRVAEMFGDAIFGADDNMRQWLGNGQEATVYSMGPYAVREQFGIKPIYSALGELQRMNEISHVIDYGLPRWLHLPNQYALYTDARLQKTYTLMDRIDGGVTIQDVIDYPELPPQKVQAVVKELTSNIDFAKSELPQMLDRAYAILANAIEQSGKIATEYLTDWQPRNVLVEWIGTKVAGSHFSLNVIDQYRR